MSKKAFFVLLKIVIVTTILSSILFLSYKGYQKFLEILPSFQKADLSQLYEGINEDYTFVLFEEEVLNISHAPKIVDGKIYLPVDLIMERLNPNFYWDEEENILTYTTYDDVIRMKTDELTYYVNDEPLTLNLPILVLEDNMAYVPVDLLSKFSNYKMTYNGALDLLMIDDESLDARFASVSKKEAFLRIQEDQKSNYITKLHQTDVVKIYSESSEWYYVRTQEGYLGYVQKSAIESSYLVPGTQEVTYTEPFNDKKNFVGKINMVWHQVTNATAN
ncbi:MAG: hypothetical protein H7X94_01110, partial [Vallitaleaceae bacterium]|nr:hypothetical protein [Vallitaleaceae bacterium]